QETPSAQAAAAAMPELPTITTFDEYWTDGQTDYAKNRVLRFDSEFQVMYYDPEWNLLWVNQNGVGNYSPTQPGAIRFRAGDRVRTTGTIVPSQGLDAARVSVEILQRGVFPEPE